MAVYKEEKTNTWRVLYRYTDWNGERKQSQKRGFKTKREAQAWEREQLNKLGGDLDMTFKSFVQHYTEDVQTRIKESTWATKEHIIQTKLIPYFGRLKMCNITAQQIITWQNELINYKDDNGKPYSPVYLKTIHNQLSAIFNHAVRYYNLKENPCQKAGSMGKKKNREMLFWTKEKYLKFADVMMDKPMSYYAFEMLYWTGIREGELLALTPSDFDFEKRTVTINKSFQHLNGRDIITSPKTEKSNRTIQLPKFLCDEMQDYLKMLYDVGLDDRMFPVIEKICIALQCNIGDIMEFTDNTQSVETKIFSTIELFAGAGGLALGIEKAGFETLGLIEFDKDAADTLKCNRPNWRVINDDIANISCLDLQEYFGLGKGELDLLSGGAPCQSFSYAGKRLGLEDARGTLFYHYAKFLEQLQPKMFLFENVKGLLTHDRGRTYKTITDIFESTGYTIQKKVLNAWDYGVAQKRERLITIGIRNDLTDRITFDFPAPHKYKPVLRDILLDCPKSEGTPYSDYKKKIFELVPPGGYWRDIPEDIAKEYMKSCWYMEGGRTGILRRLSLDEPSLTVLTSPSQKQTDRCHPLEARPFTIRENARCQSFPDDWQFCGSVGQQYKQVGNAVPVNLAYDIAVKIKEALECL